MFSVLGDLLKITLHFSILEKKNTLTHLKPHSGRSHKFLYLVCLQLPRADKLRAEKRGTARQEAPSTHN